MDKTKLRIIFGGTPDFASAHLESLIEKGYNIVAVYTQPDREAGRGKKLAFSPVKQVALKHGIPVEQPANFKNESDCRKFADYDADLFVVVAYGVILPQIIMYMARCFPNTEEQLLFKELYITEKKKPG